MNKTGLKLGSTARESIFHNLKSKIIHLQLEPGTKISEKEISDVMEVSRTPVREAFLQLSKEGLLEIYPQSGTVVSLIDLKYTEEAKFVRTNLEAAIVRDACVSFPEEILFQMNSNLSKQEWYLEKNDYLKLSEMDDEFHQMIFEGCGKKRTWLLIEPMNAHLTRIGMLHQSLKKYWKEALKHHWEIYSCVKDKLPDQAEQVVKVHMSWADTEKNGLINRYPHYFLSTHRKQ
ncbi:GntR family transcriptional regulator [Bacillus sp. V3-13]|uniref:GntR family transcriptional regulator n=1 Tax=Bacillus sp. V3-13 TaxID=2053728 RepID=UPI000C75EA87|nr:GntR family transcriptional regulator [Bacillus sp. V3-13]PLR78198.1 GntR family transcriptional regulator [Bacillus sp. V3-13]